MSCDACNCVSCIERRGDQINGLPRLMCEMIVCSICRNKRCPHATDHRNTCTNSNAPGQVGSHYGTIAERSYAGQVAGLWSKK